MKPLSCSPACAAVVLLSACAAGGSATDVASAPSTAPSARATATTSAAGTPSPTAAPSEAPTTTPTTTTPAPPAQGAAACDQVDSYTSSATCLYDAFRQQDPQAASRYATPAAVESLFALGGYPTDDRWTFEGCSSGRETSPSSGVACHYLIPGEVHPVHVELAMRDDFVVERVLSIG